MLELERPSKLSQRGEGMRRIKTTNTEGLLGVGLAHISEEVYENIWSEGASILHALIKGTSTF